MYGASDFCDGAAKVALGVCNIGVTGRIEWWLHTVFNISLIPPLSDDLHKVFRLIGLRLLQTRTT